MEKFERKEKLTAAKLNQMVDEVNKNTKGFSDLQPILEDIQEQIGDASQVLTEILGDPEDSYVGLVDSIIGEN